MGSITHTQGYCAAAVAHAHEIFAIGIDCEQVDEVTRALWPEVLTPLERRRTAALGTAQAQAYAATCFSAKEAFFKCQFPQAGLRLEFSEVEIEVTADAFEAHLLIADPRPAAFVRVSGRYRLQAGKVFTAVSLAAG